MGEWVDGQGYVVNVVDLDGDQSVVTEDEIDEYAREELAKQRRDRRNERVARLAQWFGWGLLTIGVTGLLVICVWALIDWVGIWAVLVPVGLALVIMLVIGAGIVGTKVWSVVSSRW